MRRKNAYVIQRNRFTEYTAFKIKSAKIFTFANFLGTCKMKNEIKTKRNERNLPKRIFGDCSLDAKVGNFLNQITHFPGS